jgi:beta-glucosidase
MRVRTLTGLLVLLSGSIIFSQTITPLPYQDSKLSIDDRVDDLVSRMTLQEKVTQLFNHAQEIKRLGIPAYDWWNECLHGVARAGQATVFPQAIGLAATFDQELMFRVATAISDEARAKHHFFAANNVRCVYTGLTFWTPNINIFRDPRWGRGQETYGEDPYLTGRMAVSFVKGLQGQDAKYLKAVATVKHYAVHSGPEVSRHKDNMFINNRDLFDTYLPAFKMAVREANVQSVMCAYNRFRDRPCCGNDLLLADILREQFGFTGYVVSDCGAISNFYQKQAHDLVPGSAQAWGWSLSAGTDLNCEQSRGFITAHLDSAIRKGVINESDINRSVRRLFRARFLLGMFDPAEQVPYSKIPMSVVGSEKHLQLTLEAAEKSLVLLKNDHLLPLKNVKKVALIGPNVNNPAVLIANYHGNPVRPITPLKAFRDRLGAKNIAYTQGCPLVPGRFGDMQVVDAECLSHEENGKLVRGLKAEYFANPEWEGQPALVRIDPQIDFSWRQSPVNNLIEEDFSVRWTGWLAPKRSGVYIFAGNVTVEIDQRPVRNEAVPLLKNKKYKISVTLQVAGSHGGNTIEPSAVLTWIESERDYHQEALAAAAQADVIVFCGGISADLEGEALPIDIDGFSHGDRTHLNLPRVQQELLVDLHKTGKPIILVNFSGSALALNWENENLPAIIQAFYPGEATGSALVRLLFGDYNPSGRLPVTFYKSADDLPAFNDYSMQNRTYRYFTGTPLYPFGYGQSYTTFSYSSLKADETAGTSSPVTVTVNVENSGTMDGEEVVQLYVSNKTRTTDDPLLSLKSWQRVFLKKGEQKSMLFTLRPEAFSTITSTGLEVVKPGFYEIAVAGALPDKNSLHKTVRLTGDAIVIK